MVWWVLGSCAAPVEIRHDGYVWQRRWTPEIEGGVTAAAPSFAGLRVNAASVGESGVAEHDVSVAVLATGRPVRAVVRVDASAAPAADDLAALLLRLVDRWRAAGVNLVGVELDHDCPTSALAAYAGVVRAVRAQLPGDVLLSITALPTWTSSQTAFDALIASADEVVLQVHAVDEPSRGLFAADRALAAIAAVAPRAEHLWVALPAYGLRLADGTELRVDPAAVVDLLAELSAFDVDGVVWFRVPVPGDERAWSLAAVHDVREGRIPRGVVRSVVEDGGNGAYVVRLVDDGRTWAPLPRRVVVSGSCGLADAVGGYAVERADGVAFVRADDAPLDPGSPRPIGWVRCDSPPTVELR